MNKHAINYRALKNKLVSNDAKFRLLSREERKHLNDCYMSLILWWQENKISPEDISIEEYSELTKKSKQLLIECLETPDEWKIHPQVNNSYYKLKQIR